MDLLKLMEDRYSVRSFSNEKIEDEKVEAILRAAQLAPTACNNQPQRILIVRSADGLARWGKCTECHFNEQLVLILCYDKKASWKRSYDGQDSGYVDVSIAATHMMLEASALGIGSTWLMWFDPGALREQFDIPEDYEAAGVLAMGYASDKAVPSHNHFERKDIKETVFYEKY